MNSKLLKGDVAQAVAALKAELDGDIAVLGSGVLITTYEPARPLGTGA